MHLISQGNLPTLSPNPMNLSGGTFQGTLGFEKVLESLDVSYNHLWGEIPSSISDLTFLGWLNFSNNNFSGIAPRSHQLDTLYIADPFIYYANPLPCGDPLPNRCPGDEVPAPPKNPAEGEQVCKSDSSEKIMFYGVVSVGFVTGFWGVYSGRVGEWLL